MEQYQNVVQDLAGNVVPQASVRVLLSDGGANAVIFDVNGAQVANPTPCDAEGYFAFQAANGKYFLQVEVAGKVYKKLGPTTLYDPLDVSYRVTLAPEDFFQPDESDDHGMLQRALDYAIANSIDIEGHGDYVVSNGIVARTYRTEPAVNQDFSVCNFSLKKLRYTGISGECIRNESPSVSIRVKRLIGPGPEVGITSGLRVFGQGDAMNRIDWVSGFRINIDMSLAYSHTVHLGYCHDAIFGVLINGNANKVLGGRIGGQFTNGDVSTDPSSCDVGVCIVSGSANEISSNVEYCRRTVTSGCIMDNGEGTIFTGYVESGNAFNYRVTGNGCIPRLVSGNNKLEMAASLEASGDNKIKFLSQQIQAEVAATGSNSTLAFKTPSQFCTTDFSEIVGRQGYREMIAPNSAKNDPVNQIFFSNNLNGASWSLSAIGTASWAGVAITTDSPAWPEAGYRVGTRMVFPAKSGNTDIYVATQTNRIVRQGATHFGMLVKVVSGDITFQVRILDIASGLQTDHVVRLKASNKWVNLAARYFRDLPDTATAQFDLQFRTYTGATIDIANTFISNEASVFAIPVNPFNSGRVSIKGPPLPANTFENGRNTNGAVRDQISPAIASGGQFLLGDYPTILVTGGWDGNLFFQPSIYGDGHRFDLKRDGVAASSATMQILPSGCTVDGSSLAISIAAPYTKLSFQWSTASGGWLRM